MREDCFTLPEGVLVIQSPAPMGAESCREVFEFLDLWKRVPGAVMGRGGRWWLPVEQVKRDGTLVKEGEK